MTKLGLEVAPSGTDVQPPVLSIEDQLKNVEGEIESRKQQIVAVTESAEGTRSQLNKTREGLGLPPAKEEPHSVLSDKDNLEKLRKESEDLERQREELVSKQEREKLIREEKEKIIKEKLDALFKEFEKLDPKDLESILNTGKTLSGTCGMGVYPFQIEFK